MADISKIKTPDGTTYDIKDTTARGMVVANPTLAGTESDLTALQVGSAKYKVPSGGGVSADGILFPNFDGLTPLSTATFNTTASGYYKICARTNSGITSASEFIDRVLFRVTVTGTNIFQQLDVIAQGSGALSQPLIYANNRALSVSAATSGIYYLRSLYPNALNNGYNWELEFYAYNSTARTVKIEVFKTTSAVTWQSTKATSQYNSTYQTAKSITLSDRGIFALNNVPIVAANANVANVVNSILTFTSAASALPTAGVAIPSGALIYFSNDGKAYPASTKTVPINCEAGLMKTGAKTVDTPVYWYDTSQKTSMVPSGQGLTYDTLVARMPVYLRCTTSNGEVYSDAYLSNSITAGYTWCYIGVSVSASSIALDTTHSLFLTLDANGKLTHVNGREIPMGGGGGGGTPYTSNPEMDGTASPGSSDAYARGDHVHPTDTSRQAKITASGVLVGNGSGGVTAKTLDTSSLTNDNNHVPTSGVVKSAIDNVLPAVTATDNGKVLMVVNGAWAKASLPVYNGGVS